MQHILSDTFFSGKLSKIYAKSMHTIIALFVILQAQMNFGNIF